MEGESISKERLLSCIGIREKVWQEDYDRYKKFLEDDHYKNIKADLAHEATIYAGYLDAIKIIKQDIENVDTKQSVL